MTKKSSGIYTTMPPDVKEWCRNQRAFHGSMAAYIRFLINLDVRGLISSPDKVIHIHNKMPIGHVYDEDGKVISELKEVLKEHYIE